MKKATKNQIFELLQIDPMTLVDAIGLDIEDCQLCVPVDSNSSLKISVRPGLKSQVPENISVVIDNEELLVDYDLDEDFQEYKIIDKLF